MTAADAPQNMHDINDIPNCAVHITAFYFRGTSAKLKTPIEMQFLCVFYVVFGLICFAIAKMEKMHFGFG